LYGEVRGTSGETAVNLILHEDEHLLVINKPAGWNTHAPAPYAGEGVYDWLRHREPRWAKLAIIHRLDKETSGVLAFGKTPEANRSLTEQFAARSVQKKYLLLTDRAVKTAQLIATSTIVRAGDKYVSRPLHAGGDRAETHFSVASAQEGRTLLEAEPVTGRTHQIRVHAAEHGFPILGDTLYGGAKAGRVFLHAAELSLTHPVSHETLTFRAPCEWGASPFHSDTGCPAPAMFREAIVEPRITNAFRLIHGASDDWPGLYVEKLGDYLLVQSADTMRTHERELVESLAISCEARGVYHKALNRNVRGASAADSSPQLIFGESAPERFTLRENGLSFEMSFSEGYSVGLFLDQRDNRRRFLTSHIAAGFELRSAGSKPEILNTFAYTCGFSVAAAKAGARVTSLDLSKKYLEWGRRNFTLNALDPLQHDFIYGDTFDWMRRLSKKSRVFDAIILDPPTFSQSKESGTWQAEKDYGKLIAAALLVLKPGGVIFASTNAAKLEPEKFLLMIEEAAGRSRRKILQQHYVPQPPDFPISRDEPAYLKTVWLRVA
jgi:23S rRNA (cytosine1962-C5)-methyltransferase